MWLNRRRKEALDTFKDIEEEFGLDNLVVNNVLTAYPALAELSNGQMRLVNISGTLRIVIREDGKLKEATFTDV